MAREINKFTETQQVWYVLEGQQSISLQRYVHNALTYQLYLSKSLFKTQCLHTQHRPYLGLCPSNTLLPSICKRTLTRSVGLAMNWPPAPAIMPEGTAFLWVCVSVWGVRVCGRFSEQERMMPVCIGASKVGWWIEHNYSYTVMYACIIILIMHSKSTTKVKAQIPCSNIELWTILVSVLFTLMTLMPMISQNWV